MANTSFENKMKKLDELIAKLEDKDLSLQESILIYESAVKLAKELTSELDEATKKVKMIDEEGCLEDFKEN